jgi:DNA repair protein RecO (recombination protein O)
MPLLSTEAIVLSSLRLGEEDKLITFFSLTRGKISGVAKGARRFKNRFGASLEPFTHCHLVLFEKPNNKLARVSQADILYSFRKLREAWEPIERGTEMVQLLLRITPEEQPHPNLYHLLKEGLALLETGVNLQFSTILFMAYLIAESGYQPRWHHCVRCNRATQATHVTNTSHAGSRLFSYKDGGLICPQCATSDAPYASISVGALAFLQTISKIDFRSAHQYSPSMLILREIETLLKDYMSYIIGRQRALPT